ncbi:tandem-95 repeat protein, partial [Candidatus Desantisbacteria bacterium]|nr:tandem-95 repeat protein [Candidatus Desantisbacteria bacterium]
KTIDEKQTLEFAVTAIDPDNDTLKITATGLPAGAIFDTTNTFSWIPEYNQAGTYPVTFSVTDGMLSDTETINISVGDVNRAPVLTAIGNKMIKEKQTLEFTVNATDPDNDILKITASGLPDEAIFDTTNTFKWIPEYNQSGIYTIIFNVSDGILNNTEIVNIIVNNTNRAPILSEISSKTIKENQLLEFTINAVDTDGDNLKFTAGGLPDGAIFDSTNTFRWKPGFNQSGIYYIDFIVNDGNLSDNKIVNLTVDNVNRPPVLSSISDKVLEANNLFTFTVSAYDPDMDNLQFTVSGLPEGAVFDSANIFMWIPEYIQSGIHTISFTVSDEILSDTKTMNITVEKVNRVPVLAVIGNKVIDEKQMLEFTVNATDPDGDKTMIIGNRLPDGAIFDTTNTFRWVPEYTQSGTYPVSFNATDGILSNTETINITVNNVNRTPVLTEIGDKTIDEGTLLEFIVNATDPDNDILKITVSGLPDKAVFDTTNTFKWIPDYNQSGIYTLIFNVSDGILNNTKIVNMIVNNTNRAPVLEVIGDKIINENQMLEFTVTAIDPDGDNLKFTVGGLPDGAIFDSTNTFKWLPVYNQAGIYIVTFIVTDGVLIDTKNVKITVKSINRTPTLSAIGDKIIDEGQMLTFAAKAADPDGDNLVVTATGLPDGATYDSSNIFKWIPGYNQSGNYSVMFIATDGILSDTKIVNIIVNDINRAPVLSKIGDKIALEGQILEFALDAVDSDGDTLTFTALGLPVGAVIDNKKFKWELGYTHLDKYSITFIVSDKKLSDSETINIIVKHINRAPVFSDIGNKTVNENQMLEFKINAIDPDGDSIKFTAIGIPEGVVFDSVNIFKWIPGYTQAGIYSVTFIGTDGKLSITKNIEVTVVDVNRAPVLSAIGDKTIDEGKMLKFRLSANDQDRDSLSFRAIGLPLGASLDSTNTFKWIPDYNQSGIYSVKFIVTDGLLTASEIIKINVNNVSDIPAAPDNLTAKYNIGIVMLSWHDNSRNETGFKLERYHNGKWKQIALINPDIKSFIDIKGRRGFYYRVRAYNDIGNSAYSNIYKAVAKKLEKSK